MAIPDYQSLMLPVLKLASDGAEHRMSDVVDMLATQLHLTEAEREELLPSGKQPVFNNRVHWAKTYLAQAKLLESTRRAFFKITERGRSVLSENLARITVFANVPPRLERAVRRIKPDPSNPDTKYVSAALYVALNYIQLDARDAATKEFMRAPDDLNGPPDYEFSCRLLDIGEMLFNLRSTVNFIEICRRLKRDIRSGFFYAFSARMFFDSGFEIFATPEIQQKGEDFDFKAVRGVETINVEVTALTAPLFSEKTVLSALKEKRKQLPKGSPAVIFCIFPDAWWYPVDLIKPRLDGIRRRFFGSTERVNALVFLGQDPIGWSQPGHGSMPYLQFPFSNVRARHPIEDDSFLRGRVTMTPELRAALKTGQSPELLRKTFRVGEFYQWVDHLLP